MPSVSDVEFVERLGHGLGGGRFRARLGDAASEVSLLFEGRARGDRERLVRWAQRLQSVEHPGVPRVKRIEEVFEPAFVAFEYVEGQNLEARLALQGYGLDELSALSVTLQAAAALRAAHLREVTHGGLTPRSVLLLPREDGLDAVRVVGWTPPPLGQSFGDGVRMDLRALGGLLYVSLTGSLPPSSQRPPDAAELDGAGGGGAFDDILMDWVDVDRELRGLGRPALRALSDVDGYLSIDAFIDDLLPHFRQRLGDAVAEAERSLATDAAYHEEVERHRQRVREMEARLRQLKSWLHDRQEETARREMERETLMGRRRALENVELEMSMLLDRRGRPAAPRLAAGPDELGPRAYSPVSPTLFEASERYSASRRSALDTESVVDPTIRFAPQEPMPATLPRPHYSPTPAPVRPPLVPAPRKGVALPLAVTFAVVVIGAIVLSLLPPPEARSPVETGGGGQSLAEATPRTSGALGARGADGRSAPVRTPSARGTAIGGGGGPGDAPHAAGVPAAPPQPKVAEGAVGERVEPRPVEPPAAASPSGVVAALAPVLAADPSVVPQPIDIAEVTPALDAGSAAVAVAAGGLGEAPPESDSAPDAAVASPALAPPALADSSPPAVPPSPPAVAVVGTSPALPAEIPETMVLIPAGRVHSGLPPAALERAIEQCRRDREGLPIAANCKAEKFSEEMGGETVSVPAFLIDRLEVSQADYMPCRNAGKCAPLGLVWDLPTQPATGVTREMAAVFCEFAGGRLPTHLEWLRAARGDDARLFPWGDAPPVEDNHHRGNFGEYHSRGPGPGRKDGHKYAAPVGTFGDRGESPFGVQNMADNVREWLSTDHDGRGMVAGGGWRDPGVELRVTRRDIVPTNTLSNDLGFRCVRDVVR